MTGQPPYWPRVVCGNTKKYVLAGTATKSTIAFPIHMLTLSMRKQEPPSMSRHPDGRILVVEDDGLLAFAIVSLLRGAGYYVKVATSVESALHEAKQERFDLITLDLGLPGPDGLELLRSLRAAKCSTPVIIVSARDAVSDRVRGLDGGADDYLTKPFAMTELSARVRALLRRATGVKTSAMTLGRLTFDRTAVRAFIDDEPLPLRAREWRLLELLLDKVGKMVSTEMLQHMMKASPPGELSDNALQSYVSRLRPKIAPAGLTIRGVRGFGYILERTSPDLRLQN